MFDFFRLNNGRIMSGYERDIVEKDEMPATMAMNLDRCADCGGEAHRQFSLKFTPWKYVITCKQCGQKSGYHNDAISATTEWNRRQREKMSINTKCAECGGTAHLKFGVLDEPWRDHYVVICENCGECGEPSQSFIKA